MNYNLLLTFLYRDTKRIGDRTFKIAVKVDSNLFPDDFVVVPMKYESIIISVVPEYIIESGTLISVKFIENILYNYAV